MNLVHLGIRVTTYCNLNCKDCADLVPYEKNCHYDINQFFDDMNKILRALGFIEEVLIGGGETFLYPNLNQIIDFCIQNPQIGRVILITNGSINPSPSTVALLKNKKVTLRVSGYSESVIPNRPHLIKTMKEEDIHLDDLAAMTWYHIGDASCRHRTEEELADIWNMCSMNYCVTLSSNGRIYWCGRQIAADLLEEYPSPEPHEYIDVRVTDERTLRELLSNFVKPNWKYISTCNYCDGLNKHSRCVFTAAQIVPKELVLELLNFEMLLRSNKENMFSILWDYKHFIEENYVSFLYETYCAEALKCTSDAIAQLRASNEATALDNLHEDILKCWNKFHLDVFKEYRFLAKDPYNQLTPEQIRFHEKNTRNAITIGVATPESLANEQWADTDILITLDDIAEEQHWENIIDGYYSPLRQAFIGII